MMSIPKTEHLTRRTLVGMSKALMVALVTGAAIATGGIAAEAQSDKPVKCKTLAPVETIERRVTISGVPMERTVTTAKQRCRGKVSVIVTYSVWRKS